MTGFFHLACFEGSFKFSIYQYFIPFYYLIILRYIDTPCFVCPPSTDRYLHCFHLWLFEECCTKLSSASFCVDIRFHFSWTYNSELDQWVMWWWWWFLFSGVRLFATQQQPSRLFCPPLSPGVYSNSCPQSQWCYPTISSSAIPSPFAFSLSQHQDLFQLSGLFTSGYSAFNHLWDWLLDCFSKSLHYLTMPEVYY